MAYFEGEVPVVSGNNGNGMWGGDGAIWAILLLALLGGRWGNGNGLGGGSTTEALGYELGKVATTNDVANGFAQNTLQRGVDDILIGQQQIINYNNQGFSGLNTALLSGFHGVDNAVCTLGYQTQTGFNSLASQMASCCCDIKSVLLENRYLNERQTCDLITNSNANTQRIIDYLTNDKIASLQAENTALRGKISNDEQSAYLLSRITPNAIPAYVVPSPNCCYGYNSTCSSVQ